MFELLMELPLFQGVSRDSMAAIVGAAKFHFLKFPAGETILRAHDPCNHITFVISGSVRSTVVNTSGSFAVSQTLKAPAVLAPDFLFGRVTEYPATVVAEEATGILQISKPDYLKILNSDSVFLFNYLNLLSVNAQKAQVGILSLTKGEVDERIAFWITALTQKGGTDIKLTCRSRDLCSLFNTPRSIFIAALDNMKQRGLLDYTNVELSIHSREDMLALLLHTPEPSGD
ncbi:MAG: Crp/Fnr family transcriptional regulator [Muribaculaceae bacterium]|nr:Crp/Fnr family transcriptional regulator [Muribaculaceae bacterium]